MVLYDKPKAFYQNILLLSFADMKLTRQKYRYFFVNLNVLKILNAHL